MLSVPLRQPYRNRDRSQHQDGIDDVVFRQPYGFPHRPIEFQERDDGTGERGHCR